MKRLNSKLFEKSTIKSPLASKMFGGLPVGPTGSCQEDLMTEPRDGGKAIKDSSCNIAQLSTGGLSQLSTGLVSTSFSF